MNQLGCDEIMSRLYEFLDGEMHGADHDSWRVHIDSCAGCFSQATAHGTVTGLLRRAVGAERAPDHLRARINERLALMRVGAEAS